MKFLHVDRSMGMQEKICRTVGETPKSEKRNRLSPLTSARVSMHYSYILSPSQSAVTDYIGLSVLSRVSERGRAQPHHI
jgi:hypothetical protein